MRLTKAVGCAECDALTHALDTFEREYANASGWLNDMQVSQDSVKYMRMRQLADDARVDYEVARIELERHQRAHVKTDGRDK